MTDSTATAVRLRRAARKVFARKGFDAASVREITGIARANLGAITYHYASKQALYHAVLEEVFEDLTVRVEQAAAGGGTPQDRLSAIVEAFFAFLADAPDAPLLVIREVAGSGPPPAPVIPRIRRIIGTIIGVVDEGRARGIVRDVPALLVAFSLVSQCIWFGVIGHQMPRVLGMPENPGDLRDRMRRHIADVVRRTVQHGGPHA